MDFTHIIAVLITALIPMFLGMFWYSKAAFGNLWMRYEGITPEIQDRLKDQPMAGKMVAAYIGNVIMAYILTIFLNFMVVAAIMPALTLGFYIWIGFMFPVALTRVLWDPHSKPCGYLALNSGFFLVSILLMSVVLALWI